MANVQKYAAAATGHMTAHYERRMIQDPETGKMEYVNFGNQDIDLTRTHLNYNLAPEREGGQVAFIQQRTTEARTMKRDDVKVLCSWVVTLPRQDEYGEERIYTDQDTRKFFQVAYRELADRYGEKNVVSAYVHMDEATPHMHFAFVPVIQDKKRGGEKVSAKEVLTRSDLQTFHVDLQKRMDERFGIGFFPVLNGNTAGGNRTILEMKLQRSCEDLTQVDSEVFQMQLKVNEKWDEYHKVARKLERAEQSLKLLEAENGSKQAEVAQISSQLDSAREELQLLDRAIKEKNERGEMMMGRAGWNDRIAKLREKEQTEQKVNLLAKFAQFLIDTMPGIRQLWEKFVQDQARGKVKSRDNNKGHGE